MLGSLSQDASGYHRSLVHAGIGQGGEEVMGKKLDFPTPLNHKVLSHIYRPTPEAREPECSQAPPPVFHPHLSVRQPCSPTASCILGDTALTTLQGPMTQSFAIGMDDLFHRSRWGNPQEDSHHPGVG